MTALTEYQRLEAAGNWRAGPDQRAREVVVSVGDATLILTDPKSDTPLSHWSLPAVTRLNPGKTPAIYGPVPEGGDEQLEIDDPLMINAIERVHNAIESRRAHPGRLRGGLTAAGIAIMVLLGVLWLPGALVQHAARIAPRAQAADIGAIILADVERSAGQACNRNAGNTVLDHLAPRLLGQGARIVVLPAQLPLARRLPGDLFIVGRGLLDGQDDADVLAGHLLAAATAEGDAEVLRKAIERAGPRAALQLLTAGYLPVDALPGYGEAMLSTDPPRPDDQTLLAAMTTAGVPSEPYARSIDPTGEAVLALIEADPFRADPPAKPLLTDQQWEALQQICDG